MRKSMLTRRSSFPSGAGSLHATVEGRRSGGHCSAATEWSAPSKWRRKYSALAGGPQEVRTPNGQHSGEVVRVVWVRCGEVQASGAEFLDNVAGGVLARSFCFVCEIERVAIEGWVRRKPSEADGEGIEVGDGLPSETPLTERARQEVRASAFVAPLV